MNRVVDKSAVTERLQTLSDSLASRRDLAEVAQAVYEKSAQLDQRLQALSASIDEALVEKAALRSITASLLKVIDDTRANTDGKWPEPDSGCIECTQGATPDRFNTGPCAYHRGRQMLRDAAERIFAECACDGAAECAHCIALRQGDR